MRAVLLVLAAAAGALAATATPPASPALLCIQDQCARNEAACTAQPGCRQRLACAETCQAAHATAVARDECNRLCESPIFSQVQREIEI